MQGKKNQNQNNSELPTHLDMTVRERFNLLNLWSVEVVGMCYMFFQNPRFTGQDLRMLIMANSNHVK